MIAMKEQTGWQIIDGEVIPVGEEHVLGSEQCSCKPWKTADGIWVHRAFDRREYNEPDAFRPADS